MNVWIIAVVAVALLVIFLIRRVRHAERIFFINCFVFPAPVLERLRQRRPELDMDQLDMVCMALRDFFVINQQTGRKMVAMPSQAADDLWHEFILFTRLYKGFCHKAFGRYLHHTPSEAMQSATVAQEGIRRAWFHACKHEGIDPHNPNRLPRLFALDASLNISDGFYYALNCKAHPEPNAAGALPYCASHIGGGGCSGDSGGCSSCGGD